MLDPSQIDAIRQYARSDRNLVAVYVFGSVARGAERSDSDVDLAVQVREPIEGLRLVRMETELSNAIGRDVDLVVFGSASPLLKHQILSARSLLYEGDPRERIAQETAGRYEYLDTRFLHREVRGLTHVYVEVVSRKLAALRGYVDSLEAATDITWERYRDE